MGASVFTYTDWITYGEGSPTRLQRLRLHIKEVSDRLATGDYTIEGRSVSTKTTQEYLDRLLKTERFEAEQVGLTQGTRVGMTQLRARRRP